LLGAGHGALAAFVAVGLDETKLGPVVYGLWIITPAATEEAALQEDQGPYPRPIMDTEALYVGDYALERLWH
jgi:hypothetical protein